MVPLLAQTTPAAGPENTTSYAILGFMLFVSLLPFLISFTRSRGILVALALICCLLAIGSFGLTLLPGGSNYIVTGFVGLWVYPGPWVTGLMFGLAAAIDGMAEERQYLRDLKHRRTMEQQQQDPRF